MWRFSTNALYISVKSSLLAALLSCAQDPTFTGSSSMRNAIKANQSGEAQAKISIDSPDLNNTEGLPSVSRTVELVSDYDPAKLVLIVDDSSSMSNKQNTLASSIRNGLTGLKGKNVEVYLYSTTQALDFGSPLQNSQMTIPGLGLFSNHIGQYATGGGKRLRGMYLREYVANPGTTTNFSRAPFLNRLSFWESNGASAAADLSKPFDGDGLFEIFTAGPSRFSTGTVKITSKMSNSEFEAALDKIAAEVKLGEGGASQGELPLCTLAGLIENDGPFAPFTKGDKVGFVILTDEDQANLACLRKYTAKAKKKDLIGYYPQMLHEMITLPIEVKCDSGGIQAWCRSNTNGLYTQTADCVDNQGKTTCVVGKRVCDANQLQIARAVFEKHYSKDTNTRRVAETIEAAECAVSGTYQSPAFNPTEAEPVMAKPGIACTDSSFTMVGTNGEKVTINKSMLTYFKEKYPKMDIKSCFSDAVSHVESEQALHDFEGVTDIGSLKTIIKTKADALFGQENHAFLLIGNLGDANPAGCSALSSAKSTQIIDLVGTNRAISICEPSYAKALQWFETFTKFKPDNEFEIKETTGNLKAVVLKRVNQAVTVIPGENYIVHTNGTVTFKNGILQAGDQLEFRYDTAQP
jgi:hypothetical protein